jgi:aminoglycoside 3-N-acetyltransferase
MYTKEDLKACLARMGLKGTDTVLMHSSMKSIGEVENRADGVLDALIEYFADGLLVLPSMSYSLVNAKQPVFAVRDTPCCVSLLPELFRHRSGVIRSLHPTHAVAAIGKDAAEFVSGHEKFDSPAHPDSPWGKLYRRNAKIMFVGTTLHCNTFLHGVEEWLPVPGMLTDYHEQLVVYDYDGNRIEVPSRRHVGGHSKWYNLMEEPFRKGGALTEGQFGDAHTYIVDAHKAGDITYAVLKENPLFFSELFREPQQ